MSLHHGGLLIHYTFLTPRDTKIWGHAVLIKSIQPLIFISLLRSALINTAETSSCRCDSSSTKIFGFLILKALIETNMEIGGSHALNRSDTLNHTVMRS